MELRRVIASARDWLPVVLACLVIGGVGAFLVSRTMPNTYEASATLIVGQSLTGVSPTADQILVAQRLSSTYATVATTRPNLEAVIAKLKLADSPDDLAKQVTAEAALDSTLLTITARASDPSRAAAIANAVAAQLIAVSPAIQGLQTDAQQAIAAQVTATQEQLSTAERELAALYALPSPGPADTARIDTLESRLATLRSTYASLLAYSSGFASNILSLIEPADAPSAPVSPRTLLNVLLGGFLGLLVAGMILFARDHLDESIKTPEQAEAQLGLPVLGVVRRMTAERGRSEAPRLVALLYPRSASSEAYRMLRANVEFSGVDEPIRTLLVTSAVPGEGKTVTASNLAVVFAQAGRRVLLVDADFRRPGVHNMFSLPNGTGLTTLLRSDDPRQVAALQATQQDGLTVLPTGPLPANPAELLGSRRMATIIDRLKAGYDLVIIDSPPVQTVADAAILSAAADATLIVVGAGRTRRGAEALGRESLERAGARMIGVVLNMVATREPEADTGYYTAFATDGGSAAFGAPSEARGSRERGGS